MACSVPFLRPKRRKSFTLSGKNVALRAILNQNRDLLNLAFDWTLRLNRAATYDSFYLVLADTLSPDLWTVDRYLHDAADLPWVRWVGEE